jgi:hypothetical protein
MDKTVLSIDDLTVDSFVTATEAAAIGKYDTGCIGPCENQVSGGFC